MSNTKLNNARKNKKDEFYTRYEDIEKEIKLYDKSLFRNKTIYCNCDDYTKSNFVKYFKDHFKELGLKKLISTCYVPNGKGKYYCYEGIGDGWKIDLLKDGSFDSCECVDILKHCDIVITNPPFSKWRDYFYTIMKYNKQFLIIGNLNAVGYKVVFPYIKNNEIWIGNGFNSAMKFIIPNDYEVYSNNVCIDEENNRLIGVDGTGWYTNLEVNQRLPLVLNNKYIPEKYPVYDNYNAINVNKVEDIPVDYYGNMGVPISFIRSFNKEQFEIVDFLGTPVVEQKNIYKRIIIKRKQNGIHS